MSSQKYGEKNVAITGIGQSEISRGATKSALQLTVDACLEAIRDAGLRVDEIDGLSAFPSQIDDGNGFGPIGAATIMDALRLKVNWYSGNAEGPGQLSGVFNAIGAINAGLAKHVVVFRVTYEATARKKSYANALTREGQRQHGRFTWYAPYYSFSAATLMAMWFNKYAHESGIKPETVAQLAINQRRNASLNPKAIYRTPITVDDYMNSPIISTPLRLFDCDLPCDGCTAVVVSRMDAAKDMKNTPIRIEAVGSSMKYRHSWSQLDALDTQAQPKVAEMMWSRTDLKPKDVDVAQLYDGFTYHTINNMEAFGFCEKYGAKDFIGDGSRLSLEGELPINTGGGALSAGRLHAYGALHEACVQVWGRGGDRQVKKPVDVTLVSTAGGPLCGAMLLVKE